MDIVSAIIETPSGSANKYEYDQTRQLFKLSHHLQVSMVYPAEYGFVPDTLDDDGGPLDVLVLTEYPTFAGCGIKAKILGMCVVTDEHGRDCKLLCVPVYDAKWKDATDITDVPKALLDKISHFFNTYKDLEETGWTKVEGWSGREEALKELAASRRRRAG